MNLTAVYLEINHVNYTIETETWGHYNYRKQSQVPWFTKWVGEVSGIKIMHIKLSLEVR